MRRPNRFRPNETVTWVLAGIFISYLLFVSVFGVMTGR
jgi:hypothetical protein